MPQFPTHGVQAHRRAVVECLQPGRAVGVAEEPVPDLSALPPDPPRDPIEEPACLAERGLLAAGEGRKQQPTSELEPRPEHPRPEQLLELRPEREHPPRGLGLEATPVVRPKRHGAPVEAHVIELEPQHLGESATREQKRSDQRGGEVGIDGFTGGRHDCRERAGGLKVQRGIGHFEPSSFPTHDRGLLHQRGHRVETHRHELVLLRPAVEVRQREEVRPHRVRRHGAGGRLRLLFLPLPCLSRPARSQCPQVCSVFPNVARPDRLELPIATKECHGTAEEALGRRKPSIA